MRHDYKGEGQTPVRGGRAQVANLILYLWRRDFILRDFRSQILQEVMDKEVGSTIFIMK